MTSPETLFHYCSTATFHSILSFKTLRLSSLNLSNDTMEGKWALDRFADACKIQGIAAEDTVWLRDWAGNILQEYGGLGLCLSEKEDMLSQWRGYADDGNGICIGFNTAKLLEVMRPGTNTYPHLLSIEYDKDKQVEKLRHIASDVREQVEAGALRSMKGTPLTPQSPEEVEEIKKQRLNLRNRLMFLGFHLYGMKNTAFHEEAEWRLFAPYIVNNPADHDLFKYAYSKDRIKPFREFPITPGEKLIDVIYTGPRNITPRRVVQNMLQQSLGYYLDHVYPSAATYR